GGVDLADGAVGARVDAADAAQPREIRQQKPQVAARLALAGDKLGASSAARGPRLPGRLLSRATSGRGSVTPALPLRGRPPGVGAGEDVLDVVVDQHDVELAALVPVVLREFRVGLPLDAAGCLLLAQEDEVVELGGMVAISV